MKIVHILFDDYPFVVDWGYQENKFVKYQIEDNDVTIITGKYIPDVLKGFLQYSQLKKYEEIHSENHILKIYRLDVLFGNTFVGKKTRYYKGLRTVLMQENPDFIFVHDLHSFSLKTVNDYVKSKKILCNADVHVNYVNSCKNKVSYFLHNYIYRNIIQKNISAINSIFYLNENSKQFIEDLYGLNEIRDNLKFLPLGGEISSIEEKKVKQKRFKLDNNLSDETIIFIHSGKMNKQKKTIDIIDTFAANNAENFCLLLIGTPADEIKQEFFAKIQKDSRIHYLGWKTNDELLDYLLACDVYLQPGSPSVTAHEALCKGCATVLSSEGNFYTQFIDSDSAIYVTDNNDLRNLFDKIQLSPEFITKYKITGYTLAKKIFDYKTQSTLILIGNCETSSQS